MNRTIANLYENIRPPEAGEHLADLLQHENVHIERMRTAVSEVVAKLTRPSGADAPSCGTIVSLIAQICDDAPLTTPSSDPLDADAESESVSAALRFATLSPWLSNAADEGSFELKSGLSWSLP